VHSILSRDLLVRASPWRAVVLFALLIAARPATAAPQLAFEPLGFLPGATQSEARGVSADGSTVAGASKASTHEAFRWSAATGMVSLGPLPLTGQPSVAHAVNADGTVVVGGGTQIFPGEAFRWSTTTGSVSLTGGADGSANGVDSSGDVVVGFDRAASGAESAFRWTAAGGRIALGDLPGGAAASNAFAVSADGAVVVGSSGSTLGFEAFRWTAAGGMVGLGLLPGSSFDSVALDANADGSVVIGVSGSAAAAAEGFRWTAAGGMQGLGLPAGASTSEALALDAAGDVVVGRAFDNSSGFFATIWTSATGMLDLRGRLVSLGVPGLVGWRLETASDISADGRVVVGTGIDPLGRRQAWRAVLGEPWSVYCTAKLNSLGCTPSIAALGQASASNAAPFVVSVHDVRNAKAGLFFYEVGGARQSVPFQGGTLCLGPSGLRRTPVRNSGGSAPPANDCSGVHALDFNAFAAGLEGGTPDPALRVAGNTYLCQLWGRDPGFAAPLDTTLSDALEAWIGP